MKQTATEQKRGYLSLTDDNVCDTIESGDISPYKRPSDVAAVLSAIMEKVHDIKADMDSMIEAIEAARNDTTILQRRIHMLEQSFISHTGITHAEPDLRGM